MRATKNHAALPVGRTARIAYDLDLLRAACCQAAAKLLNRTPDGTAELEECAMLDDALAEAQRVLKFAVRKVMLSRLSRSARQR